MNKLNFILFISAVLLPASSFAAGSFAPWIGHYVIKSERCFSGENSNQVTPGLTEIPCPNILSGITVIQDDNHHWTLTETYANHDPEEYPLFEGEHKFNDGSSFSTQIQEDIFGTHWKYHGVFYPGNSKKEVEVRSITFKPILGLGKLLYFNSVFRETFSASSRESQKFIRQCELERTAG